MLDMMTFAPNDGTCGTERKYDELPVKIYRADRDCNRKENDLCNSDLLYVVLGYDVSNNQSVHIMGCDTFLTYLMYVTTIVCAMKVINIEDTSSEDRAICNHIIAETTKMYGLMAGSQDTRKMTFLSHLDKHTNNFTQISVWYHGIGQLYINPQTFTDEFLRFCLDCATDDGGVNTELLSEEFVKCGLRAYNSNMPTDEFDDKVHDILVKLSNVR